eukprot:4301275-Pleurochrysis_carterae.AAC.1
MRWRWPACATLTGRTVLSPARHGPARPRRAAFLQLALPPPTRQCRSGRPLAVRARAHEASPLWRRAPRGVSRDQGRYAARQAPV